MSPSRTWLIVLALSFGPLVSNSFARFSYGLILPAMKADLGWNYAQAGALNTANAIGYLIGAVLVLTTSNIISPVRMFRFGMITTALALVMTGTTENYFWLNFWRILTGIAAAPVYIAGSTLVATCFAQDSQKNALAIILYFAAGGFGMLITGTALPLGFDWLGDMSWPYSWILLGIISLLSFPAIWWASRQISDQLNDKNFGFQMPNWRTIFPILAGYFFFAAGYLVYFTFAVQWIREKGAHHYYIILFWGILSLAIMFAPLLWRGIFARFNNGIPLALGTLIIAAGVMIPLIFPGWQALLLSAIVYGLSVLIPASAVTNFTKKNASPVRWNSMMALFTTVFAVGQTIGPIAAGWIADATNSLSVALACSAFILLAGTIIAFLQKPLKN